MQCVSACPEPVPRGSRLTVMTGRILGGMPVRRAALLAAVCLLAAACNTREPPAPGGENCAAVPGKAWAMRLAATGRVVWQAPVRGYAHRTRLGESEPVVPVSPLVAGPVAVG
jgi:hypothetical protein